MINRDVHSFMPCPAELWDGSIRKISRLRVINSRLKTDESTHSGSGCISGNGESPELILDDVL